MTGYASEEYAASFRQLGDVVRLPRSGAHLLLRSIPGTDHKDAVGLYPLLSCFDWAGLADDLGELQDVVALSAVLDPFHGLSPGELKTCFPDLVRDYKPHHVADLNVSYEEGVSKHHRYYARKAKRTVSVHIAPDPPQLLDTWCELYGTLVARHQVTGLADFSREAFHDQLRTPGLTMLVAEAEGEVVGAQLWFVQGDVAYNHLAAASPRGYELEAQYALYSTAFDTFRGVVRFLELGGSPDGAAAGGLSAFKRGWAGLTRDAPLVGRVIDRAAYDDLVAGHVAQREFFPGYRA